MSSALRFGILGAAKIAPGALIEPARLGEEAVVAAVAARSVDRARAYAAEHNIGKVAEDYAALVADPDLDVIYNPLPMHLHAEWSIAALRAGKHVLCEKPFAANAGEAEKMVQAAQETGKLLVEAFHYRYHPFFARVLEVVKSGVLGKITSLDGTFKVAIKDRNDLRHRYDTAGGATMDLGCYPLHWMRTVMGTEPEVISARAQQGAANVDVVMDAQLRFPGGVAARMVTSMEDHEPFSTTLTIFGENGQLFLDNPLAPHGGHKFELTIDGEMKSEQIEDGFTTYRHQLVAFCNAVNTGTTLPTMGQDSIASMRLIDAIYTAAGLPVRGTAV